MPRPEGFSFTMQGDEVVILHRGRRAGVLRGSAAARFLVEAEGGDPQLLMARVTGQYRHGNERTARNHPRNLAR
ncbi:MAG: hypothetical protein ABIS84_08895 [Arachnia sp.]